MLTIKPEACPTLRTITADEIPAAFFEPVDPTAREQALVIVKEVKANGVEGLLKYAVKLGDLPEGERKYSVSKEELKAAYDASAPELQACGACMVHACVHTRGVSAESLAPAPHACAQALLQRVAARVRKFAEMQRASITEVTTTIEGGAAGQLVVPVASAGCYAPGGRYPLPSSVIMTAVTARTAGVKRVIVASPRPSAVTLAAAYVAGADVLLKVGRPAGRAGLAVPQLSRTGLLGRTLQAPGCAAHPARATAPLRAQWEAAVRPRGQAQPADCCCNDSSLTSHSLHAAYSSGWRRARHRGHGVRPRVGARAGGPHLRSGQQVGHRGQEHRQRRVRH